MATIVLFVLFLCRKTHRDITMWCVKMRGVAGMAPISAKDLLSEIVYQGYYFFIFIFIYFF